MANEPDEISTANENEVADLDTALGTAPAVDDTTLEVRTGTDADVVVEDARPGDDEDDDAAPNLPNTLSPEEKRKRNQEHRANQKRVRKEKEEQAKREIAMLRSANDDLNGRLSAIEQRSTGTEVAAVDARIKKAGEAYVWYKDQIAEQMRANNPEGVADAQDKMLQAMREHDHFSAIKTQVTQNQRRGNAPSVDPRLMALANKWMGDHAWYDPKSGDEDSMHVMVIDKSLINKGFDPATPQYWAEMDARIAKVLPHRAKTPYTPPNSGGRSPVAGGGTHGGGGSVAKGSFTLSAARVTAMKDAGVYDNPKERAAMIEQFKMYDAKHAND